MNRTLSGSIPHTAIVDVPHAGLRNEHAKGQYGSRHSCSNVRPLQVKGVDYVHPTNRYVRPVKRPSVECPSGFDDGLGSTK